MAKLRTLTAICRHSFFMVKKHRRIKKHYTVAVTSDYSVDKTKYYRTGFNMLKVFTIIMIVVVLLAVGITAFEYYELNTMDSKIEAFRQVIDEQGKTINQLGVDISNLENQNKILSNTVAMSIVEDEKQAEQLAQKHLPVSFPLSGAATIAALDDAAGTKVPNSERLESGSFIIYSNAEPQESFLSDSISLGATNALPEDFDGEELSQESSVEGENPEPSDETETSGEGISEEEPSEEPDDSEEFSKDEIVTVFALSSTSDVISAAYGIVLSVENDPIFGNKVIVDHENGYLSIYMNKADSKVNVGDEIVTGAIIFVCGEENTYFGYEIMFEGNYLDPQTVIAISG